MKVCSFLIGFFICTSPLQAVTGDLNSDGKVDFTDFLLFAGNFGAEGEAGASCESLVGDFNCNSKVDFPDFLTFAANFGSVDSGTDGDGDTGTSGFHGPGTFADILATSRTVSWLPRTQSLGDLARFSLAVAGSEDLLIIDDDGGTYAATLTVETGRAASTELTNDALLKSMFKLIEVSSSTYMIVSPKHSNYALDFDTIAGVPTLIMRDMRSFFLDTSSAAFLMFSVTTSGGSTQIAATGRQTYSTSNGFVTDDTWTAMNMAIDGSQVILTDQMGTLFTLYQAPLEQDIPFDFNPTDVTRVSNDEFLATFDGEDLLARKIKDVTDTYRDQVAAHGLDSGTTAAAEEMLSTIESTLTAEGSTLRYPAEFYTTVRENMLSRILKVSDMYDAVLGRNTIPYVYFTNEADTDGIHHPFMVIATRNVPEGMSHLWDVPRPPGDGTPGTQYPEQNVTRNATSQDFVIKIPMKDYGEVETLTENTLADNLATDEGVSDFTHLNYSSISSTGVAIDGVVVYPTLNNTLSPAQEVGEITSVGLHSGRGLGCHYHADGHSATGRGFNLYNAEDYEGRTHPPIVSFGWDGVAGYGKYETGDTTSDGVEEALDDWGGHRHGIYGYHYHSETTVSTAQDGMSYTTHMLPPRGAWRGRINGIPEFWDGRQPGGKTGGYHGIELPPMPKPSLSSDKQD